MTRQLPIGTAELAVLQELRNRGGKWTKKDGSLYESRHWTLVLLGKLVNKGLAIEVTPGEKYEITEDGRITALSGAMLSTRTQRASSPVHLPRPSGNPRDLWDAEDSVHDFGI